ncbi:MAG: chemotaxis protein CheW [Ghiorsea sp.]
MLLLCFSMGGERYALDATAVVEVIPLVRLKRLPTTPDWVSGIIKYHGHVIPVIDLCALNLGRKVERLLSTRIIIIQFIAKDGSEHLLGLLAEQVTETVNKDADEFETTGVQTPDAPHLGGVTTNHNSTLQWVDINQILPPHVQDLLFQAQQAKAESSNDAKQDEPL